MTEQEQLQEQPEQPAPQPAPEPDKPVATRRPRVPVAGDPNKWTGTRAVIMNTTPCGHCLDAIVLDTETYHDRCRHETGYYDKLWVCPCDCNADWVPQAVTLEKGLVVGSATEPLPRPDVSPAEQYKKTLAEREAKAARSKGRGRN